MSEPTPGGRFWRAIPASAWLTATYLVSVGFHFRALRHQAGFPLLATDEAQYIAVGENLRLGHGFMVRGEFHTGLPPLYPAFVAFAHSWGSDPRMSALFFSCLFISLAIVPAYGLARLTRLDRTLACITATAAVFLPNTVLAGMYMTETLSYPLFLTGLWTAARWLERPSARRALIAGTLLSLMLLTKVAALSFAGAVLLAVIVLRPGMSSFVVLGVVFITQLGWQVFKSGHDAAGIGMYGRVLGESGLPRLSGSLLGSYLADFLLAPGLLVVVPMVMWFWRHGRARKALATLLASTLVLQVVIHGILDIGLTGLIQERLYIYSMPLVAMLAVGGIASLANAGRVVKVLLVAVPLALLYLLSRYPFAYVPVVDVPWIAALGSPGMLDVLHFDKWRALGLATVLVVATALPLLLLTGRRAQLALALFIVLFNVGVFISSARKMSVLSTMGRPEIVRIAEWLAANQVKPNDKLVVCGGLAFFQEAHHVTEADQFFVAWHRRFFPVIRELQLEAFGRFDLRVAPSAEQVSVLMAPGDHLVTATRMTGLRLVSYQFPLYLYTREPSSTEPIRPLYVLDLTADVQPMDLLPGAYRLTLRQGDASANQLTLEVVGERTGTVMASRTGPLGDRPLAFTTRGGEPVRIRISGPDRRPVLPRDGSLEFVALNP